MNTNHQYSLTFSPVQSVTYNHFNSASSITNLDDQLRVDLEYGPDDQRRIATYKDITDPENTVIFKTRIYAGSYEKQINPDLSEIEIHYITAGGMLVAMYVIDDGVGAYYYPHLDHLGSIIHVTDETGTITYTQSFDAWGRTRNADDHSYSNIAPRPDWLWRGYTGHEHLDEFGLINMNGRLYDPVVGRMLSPDNVVQSPDFTQSYNRYSYVWNNPLKYTDPSGENVFDAFERFLDVLFLGFKVINEGVSWVNDRINNSPRDTYFRKGYLLEGELPYPVLANNGLPPSQTINVDGSRIMGGQVGSAGFTDASGRHYANSEFERWVRQWEQEIKNAAAKSVPAQRQKVIEKVDPYAGGGPLMASLNGYIGTEPTEPDGSSGTSGARDVIISYAESTIDGVLYFGTRLVSQIGNFGLAFNASIEYYGLFNTIDKGKFAVVAPHKRFQALGFSFSHGVRAESYYNGYGDKINLRDGIRIMNGSSFIITAPFPMKYSVPIDGSLYFYDQSTKP